ncbi:ATP-binding cassette domain-containing protein [Kurthia sibirica]|uniref:ABC transporter domain-containing protein n=1 Tax=Kurthia sibirica TaxID=202750 RepID=A0A2U3AEP5_9BACL|nr:ATP-binding cassette domain-containing protein [Kurthia sibirica]PWI23016.1 hypothetical protein DEX24_16505 [Kurthia sibirica]GEK35603.1 hypothetical protein KSI01_31360 [Kurthia sibirica]
MITINKLKIKEINTFVTLNIYEGITYISGKNGSGKTLFLDYISKIRKAKTKNISGNTNMIYMRQNFSFYNRIRVKEFIKFVYNLCEENYINFYSFLKRHHISIDIEKIKNTKMGMLSGGERKLIYILTILSLQRDWYILDEPFVNIDKETKKEIINLILQLKKENRNFILTNHDDLPYLLEHVDYVINFEEVKVHF